MTVLITEELITSGRHSTGGWNKQQLKILGIIWPPISGWIDILANKNITISKEDADLFVSLKGMSKQKTKELVEQGILQPIGRQKRVKARAIQDAVNITEYRKLYQSPRWRTLRKEVLEKYGHVCMCCGKSAEVDGVHIHVDHIKSRLWFPELSFTFDNLQVLCRECNIAKGSRDFTDYRPKE